MPPRFFEALYLAFQKRKIAEELSNRRNLQIAAIMSNPNYDEKEVNKEKVIEDIEEAYKDAINKVYGYIREDDVDLYANPFFAAGMRGLPPDPGAPQPDPPPQEKIEYDLDQE